MSVLLASHDPAVAVAADRVVRMRDGRVAEEESRHRPPSLVVDARGWVRLPASARTATRLHPQVESGGVRLSPVGPVRQSVPSPRLELPVAEPVRPALCGVTRRLGERVVLDRYDAVLAPGRLTVVAGRSGTGKTTVLRLLAGLDLPDAGTVSIDGTAWSELDAEERAAWRRQRIGFLAQEPLPPVMLTAREVLELATALRGGPTIAAEDLLESVGLGGLGAQRVERMSQGEVQRLTLVRALAGARGLLVVDEPTSRLDEAAAERVGELLGQAVAAGNTVVCATHDPRLLAIADERLDL
jgi:ABC-type lipoprotein export system ATPase subunit